MADATKRLEAEHANALLEGTERRVAVRVATSRQFPSMATISSAHDGVDRAWIATIRDVSRTGIALSVSQSFDPGALLIIEQSAPSQGVIRVPVRVVHATAEKKGHWVIGCVFVVPGSEENLLTS